MLSGLWHQVQRSGQPLKNTVVRMPGPSSVDSLCVCSMVAVSIQLLMLNRSDDLADVAGVPGFRLYAVAFAGYDLVLQLAADRGEISVIAGHADDEVAVGIWVVLSVAQHI